MLRYVRSYLTSTKLSLATTAITLITLTVLALIGVTAYALATSGAALPAGHAAVPRERSDGDSLQAELLTVRPTGFDPVEVMRAPGPFLLVVENRSGVDLGTLQLLPVADGSQPGAPLFEESIGKGQENWSRRVDLPTGVYVLKQADEPGWTCQITVTP